MKNEVLLKNLFDDWLEKKIFSYKKRGTSAMNFLCLQHFSQKHK